MESPTYLAEISTGRRRKFWKYLPSQLWDREWYAQTLLVGETRCHELSLAAKASPNNEPMSTSEIVLVPRRSGFTRWYRVPDVRTLAPPDAKNIIFKKQEFHADYFDYLVSGVILRSLGRIERCLSFNLKGKPGHPPLIWTLYPGPNPSGRDVADLEVISGIWAIC